MKDLPTVFIGVPTGYLKEYAILQMLASIRNLDYPPEKLKLCIAVTLFPDEEERKVAEQFRDNVQALLEHAHMPFEWSVLSTEVDFDDLTLDGPYCGVVKNLHAMRVEFLKDKRWQKFLVLGGDNPPPRNTLKKLAGQRGNLVSALISQRPTRSIEGAIPIIYLYAWTLKDLNRPDLTPELREQLRQAWLEFGFFRYPKGLGGKKVLHNVAFGSGCSLIDRKLFETLGYRLGIGNHSEDLHFCQYAQQFGFETTLDLTARCGHFDEDGTFY